MAESRRRAFDNFSNTGLAEAFRQTESGLLVPKDLTVKDLKDTIRDVMASSPEEQAAFEKRLDRRMGALMSLYYSLFTNGISFSGTGTSDKPRHTAPNALLRAAFRKSLVDQLVVLARIEQIKFVAQRTYAEKRQKGWVIRHKRWADPYFKPTKSDLERMEEVARAIEHPWEEVHPSFRDFAVKFCEDQLIIDRVCAPITRSIVGKPLRYYLLPGDDIKPKYDVLLRYMQKHGIADQGKAIQQIYTTHGIDLTNCAYVQEGAEDMTIYGAWKKDEIAVHISNPTNEMNNYGWGKSCFERSLDATTFLLYAFKFNRDIFSKNYPDQLLVLRGEADPIGLEYFKSQLYGSAGQQSNNRLPILPTNDPAFQMDVIKLRDTLTDLQFASLIRIGIALKCSAYRCHPSLLNMSSDPGSDAGRFVITPQDQSEIIGSLAEEGFKGLLESMADFINRYLVWPWYDDLVFCWSVDDLPPEADRVALWTQKVSMGLTADEFRASEGLPPLSDVTDGKYSGKVPLSPFILQDREMAEQQKMLEDQDKLESQRSNALGFTGGVRKTKARKKQKKPLRKGLRAWF